MLAPADAAAPDGPAGGPPPWINETIQAQGLYATELGRARSLVTGAASRVRPPASKILSR
jgi:hypothetical protein